MEFYTNCQCVGNNILLRGVSGDKRFSRKIKYQPSLFVPTNQKTEYHTLSGVNVEKMEFSSIKEARNFVEEYKFMDNFEVYGNTWFQYCYISDSYPETIEYDFSKVLIAYVDIEVASESGFPHPEDANEPIVAITMKLGDNYFVYGCGDYENHREDINIHYFKCSGEVQLIEKFLEDWKYYSPDVITGWNTDNFDIPYMINRITKILGEQAAKRLSPWNMFRTKTAKFHQKEFTIYELMGISNLDYMSLYKKFAPKTTQESYALNYIAHVELGMKKLEYDGSLHTLYLTDFQKFIEYNIRDVELVARLEEKMQLIDMVVGVAYDAKVNYNDVFSQVRMWDTIIFNHLKRKKFVIPQRKKNKKGEQYSGAYVKEPHVGMHNWIVSFDLNSLYPHLIAQFNVSPETLRAGEFKSVDVDGLLDRKYDLEYLKKKNLTMAANGHHFCTERQGFLPRILMKMYDDRKVAKKEMIKAQKDLEKIQAEINRRGLSQ